MLDAYCKILKTEGFSGLYRGFWVSSVQIVSGNLFSSLNQKWNTANILKFLKSNCFCKISNKIWTGVFYISTYEGVRHLLAQRDVDSRMRALIAGGTASIVGQTIIVPFDVLSQHLMMIGANLKTDKVPIWKLNKFSKLNFISLRGIRGYPFCNYFNKFLSPAGNESFRYQSRFEQEQIRSDVACSKTNPPSRWCFRILSWLWR